MKTIRHFCFVKGVSVDAPIPCYVAEWSDPPEGEGDGVRNEFWAKVKGGDYRLVAVHEHLVSE